jgi:hypothetical protein
MPGPDPARSDVGLAGSDKTLQKGAAEFGRIVLWTTPAFAHRCIYVRNDKELLGVSLADEESRK